ncbi:response regulator transcription factor [Vagococcus bubulae]|uniref:DNA-binding response regulator n=1 Tax=Vagococcus bubulae TaxID=1977868 RepID=A0A429ZR60_9ENTE|nr:response regulator transcription factor [Vagococcus bubulae]RST96177.1 DNA-binding response regulator [Vagococcus bubulae]
MKLLVIDDDEDLLKLIGNALSKEYTVDVKLGANDINPDDLKQYDLVILDVMMPEMTGFEFLKQYREWIDAPIILLTAKDFEKDKLEGFALGADDYVTKPFSIKEIRARVAAHLRREQRQKHYRLVDYPVSCDLVAKGFFCDETEIALTSSEYTICELLLKNKGQVFSKENLYTSVYGLDAVGDSQTTMTERVKQIRAKFHPFGVNPIKTVWGVGYKWEVEKD